MDKRLFLSTNEGRFFLKVLNRADASFRKLLVLVVETNFSEPNYRKLLSGWENFLEEHTQFLLSIPEKYGTEFTKKVAVKKSQTLLRELRKHGDCVRVQLNSELGKQLFDTAKSTEMCFKILHEHALEGDIPSDVYLNILRDFSERKSVLENYLTILEKFVHNAQKVTH